jgi:hypothetical protein
MPSMPIYFVGKGHQFKMLDEQYSSPPSSAPSTYDEVLNRIDQPLADLAANHVGPGSSGQTGLSPKDESHFKSHWLRDWWPSKPVEQVLRNGYKEAINRAKTADKPIESIWVCANEDEFQIYICEGPHQITVIVFTPPPPKRHWYSSKRKHTEEELTQDEPIWVVKVKDKFDDEYTQLGGSEYDTIDPPNNIIMRRIRYAP